ncbi:hypothetical protein [Brevundimonas sp.]|uniref:hypothetical protein n=1 Tax=Brevundimonas sp. TaxID=1871086 RepID=UPI0025C1B2F5|nr:hypothetical protein [Brevundimonas sp.]
MRRLTPFAAALSLTLAVALPAVAQTPPPAAAAPERGVVPAEVKAWLTSLGGTVADPAPVDGGFLLRVSDEPLPWSLSLFGCQTRCDDIQYNAVFTGPITEAQVTAWNRDNRYLKAVWVAPATAGADATILAQYDVLLLADGNTQLQEPTYIWLQLLTQFARTLFQSVAPAAPAASSPGQ